MRGYKDGKSDVLDEIKAEIEQLRLHKAQFLTNDNKVCIDSQDVLNVIDKYKTENKESATVAKFHDFYPEDPATWPPADEEILVKRHNGDNAIAYAAYDDSEDGGWGFYSEDGYLIADIEEIAAWMPIPRHERDKNYIPIQKREKKTVSVETHEDTEEEKDR